MNQLVDKGLYDDALALLLDFEQLEGMRMVEYKRWTDLVWTVLDRQSAVT